MLEEALVLGGEHGVDKHLREIVKANDTPLFPGAVEEIGDQFRLDFRGFAFDLFGKLRDV